MNIIKILLKTVFIITGLILISGCGEVEQEKQGTHETDHDESALTEEIVRLNEQELTEFGIRLSVAGPGKLERYTNLTGEIVIDPERLAHLHPRFPGLVKRVNKKIGDRVNKGEVLAVIEGNESLVSYELKSLIEGSVIDMHLTLGEVVEDGKHNIIIADLSKVWANLSIYQKDLGNIREGQKVYLSTGPDTEEITGKISYISPVVDARTRTATARVIVDNSSGIWRPGLFVRAQVITGDETVPIHVPKTALEKFENRTVIFIRDEDGFEPRMVTIGRTNTTTVEITSGIEAGQSYVSEGGFHLKAELQKDAFGDGHGH
ncbi:MAG: efflux RND transporter periplasmic adaptor subunit [Calditrichaceae bacterium]